MHIQWYPGHMVKAKALVKENLKLVDIVIELVDARLPLSSRNPDLNQMVSSKPRIVLLNKADLADTKITKEWLNFFTTQSSKAIPINAITGQGLRQIVPMAQELTKAKREAQIAKGMRPRAVRAMIVGIPNVGKSSFINKFVGKSTAKTGDKPGVTKGKQWVKVGTDFELLDTPGILWPKFEDQLIGKKLAATGAINDDILDLIELTAWLLETLKENYPDQLMSRYKLVDLAASGHEILEQIGAKRGCLRAGGKLDHLKAAQIVLDEFRAAKIGNMSLERPEEYTIDE